MEVSRLITKEEISKEDVSNYLEKLNNTIEYTSNQIEYDA
jgi:hypothetical protein